MAKRMALPNGATVQIATALDDAIVFTAITNAAPPVLTSVGHGLTAGDYVIVSSGWCELDQQAYKVGVVTADTFTLIGANTTNTVKYPPGGGAGSVNQVLDWQDVPCITDSSLSGGEPQYVDVECLQEDNPKRLFNGFSPIDWTMQVSDDDTNPSIAILEDLSDTQETSVLRIILRSLKEKLYAGSFSISPDSTMSRGEVMTRAVGIAVSKITKYPAP